jgi:hypothetical protein
MGYAGVRFLVNVIDSSGSFEKQHSLREGTLWSPQAETSVLPVWLKFNEAKL